MRLVAVAGRPQLARAATWIAITAAGRGQGRRLALHGTESKRQVACDLPAEGARRHARPRLPACRVAEPNGHADWMGRIAPTVAQVSQSADPGQVAGLLQTAPARGLIARGLGRSYNNAAQNEGGLVIATSRMNRITGFDPAAGLVTCEAGVSLEQLMIAALPAGWFVPVSPGTRQVTVGGAIAADVHGKNHHVAGSFAQHVQWFDLLLPDGRECRVTPESEPVMFWATAGGMGLTGIILRATIQLTKVETSRVLVDTVRAGDIDQTMACLCDTDDRFGYTVAWSDCLAKGASLGRSVITSGDFAAMSDLAPKDRRDPLAFRPAARLNAPAVFLRGLVNRHTVALANEAWYHKAPRRREGRSRPSARSSTRWTASGTGTGITARSGPAWPGQGQPGPSPACYASPGLNSTRNEFIGEDRAGLDRTKANQ